MSTFQYGVMELMDSRTSDGGQVLKPLTAYYPALNMLTHLDSVNGIAVRIGGLWYGGANPISFQLQHSMDAKDPNAQWVAIGPVVTLAPDGGAVSPATATYKVATVVYVPLAGNIILPALRLEISCPNGTAGTLQSIRRTMRGI
jgi:hypothetical protein